MLRGKRLPDQWVAGPWRSHQRRAGVHAVCCPAWSVTTKPKFYPQVNRLSEKVCKTNRAGHATTKTWPCFQANNSSLLHYVDTEAFTFVVAVFLMPLKLYYVVALLLPGIACPALPTKFISSWGETEGLSPCRTNFPSTIRSFSKYNIEPTQLWGNTEGTNMISKNGGVG